MSNHGKPLPKASIFSKSKGVESDSRQWKHCVAHSTSECAGGEVLTRDDLYRGGGAGQGAEFQL